MDTENRITDTADDVDNGDEPVRVYASPRRSGCGRIILYILIFIVIENIILPPRYQVSNNIALGLIWGYQNTISKVFQASGAVRCKFYPSCSEYGRLAYRHHGFLIGTVKAGWRILRCNPLNKQPVENWPYEGAHHDCRQAPAPYLILPDDVRLPEWVKENDLRDLGETSSDEYVLEED